jgi:hypothetical protein
MHTLGQFHLLAAQGVATALLVTALFSLMLGPIAKE